MRSRSTWTVMVRVLTVLTVLTATTLSSTAAMADSARTGELRLDVSAEPAFVVGQTFFDPVAIDDGLHFWNGGGYVEYRWTASSASGICRYTVDEDHGIEGWYEEVQDEATSEGSGTYQLYADDYPSADDVDAVRVNVYDCAGHVVSVERRAPDLRLVLDYGATVPSGWQRTSCLCAMGDSMLRTWTGHTSLSTRVNANGSRQHIGLVMAQGPRRGRAAIYVDQRQVAVVDTYAPSNVNRVVVWDGEITGSDDHTITVTNLATPGRPRIDVDAYLSA